MQISKTIMNPLALAIAILVLTVSAASAQSIWLSPEPTTGISAEILKPKFESSQSLDPDFVSSVWFLSARLRISPNTHALVELPVSFLDGERENYMYNYYGGPEFWEIDGEAALGNPFLGIEIQDRRRMWYSLFGVRLPLLDEKNNDLAKEYAILSDVDRAEAFMGNVTPISIRFGVRSPQESNLALHVYAGPTIWLIGGENVNNDNEILVDYGLQMWVKSEIARAGWGLTGRYWVSLEDADFDESTVHQLGFAANVGSGRIRPGMHFRVPLDEDWDFTGIEFIYGLNLTVLLGGDD